MKEGDFISLGVVVSVHGLKGFVKVKTYSGKADNLSADSFLYIKTASGKSERLKIKKVIEKKGRFLVSFYNIESVEQALPLVKGVIFKERKDLKPTEEDEYYFDELLGLSVFTVDGLYVGVLNEVIETGANFVISVKKDSNDRKEILFPFIKDVIKNVNLSEKKMIIDASGYLDED